MGKLPNSSLGYLSALKWALVCGLVIPVVAIAQLKPVTLAELVRKSDVIAMGDLRAASSTKQNRVAELEITTVLKGKHFAGLSEIPLCNRDVDSEHPDLAKVTGNHVIFVARTGDCFHLVWGSAAIIRVRDGRALTAALDEQPENQAIDQFLGKIHSLVDKRKQRTR